MNLLLAKVTKFLEQSSLIERLSAKNLNGGGPPPRSAFRVNQKCMMNFLVIRNYGKLSVKFLSGTSTVIEKEGLLLCFLFLARTIINIRLNSSDLDVVLTMILCGTNFCIWQDMK